MRTLTLRQLILLLTVSTALLILGNTFYTSYKTQRALLIEQTLESNHAYAAKMAASVDSFLVSAQQQLAFAAGDVLLANGDTGQLQHIAERLKQQTDSFSSTVITDPHGTALAITQPAQDFLGRKLDSTGSTQALTLKKPLISKPYISMTDHLMVFLTHPVFDAQGVYLGFVGGSIYLDSYNDLSRPEDIVCRFCGEEFVVLLPKTNTEQAHKVAERLRIYMENTNHPRIRAPITLSFGGASWPSADASIAQVMKQADAALYAAKAAGRNQVQSSPVV